MPDAVPAAATPMTAPRFRRMFEEALGSPFTTGNRIEPLKNGDAIFPAMLAAIGGAAREVELLTYVYWRGEIALRFARTLAAKAREGVPVRVQLDFWGAAPTSPEVVETMLEGGVDLRWFRSLRRWNLWSSLHRTHRKVLVVDGRVGFTGGVGIAQEWCGDARDETEWRDTHFRVTGAAVRRLRAAFLGNWGETLAEDDVPRRLPRTLQDGDDAPPPATGEAEVQVVRSVARSHW